MSETTPKSFYRYTTVEYASMGIDGEYTSSTIPNPTLILHEYFLHKETPKGYWIGIGLFGGIIGEPFWVSKNAKKRYAYPTKEEAMTNYIKRTERRIKILKRQLWSCEISLDIAKQKNSEKV